MRGYYSLARFNKVSEIARHVPDDVLFAEESQLGKNHPAQKRVFGQLHAFAVMLALFCLLVDLHPVFFVKRSILAEECF